MLTLGGDQNFRKISWTSGPLITDFFWKFELVCLWKLTVQDPTNKSYALYLSVLVQFWHLIPDMSFLPHKRIQVIQHQRHPPQIKVSRGQQAALRAHESTIASLSGSESASLSLPPSPSPPSLESNFIAADPLLIGGNSKGRFAWDFGAKWHRISSAW